MLARHDVRGVRAAVDLRLIAGSDVSLTGRGKARVALCVFHGERTPSLHVYSDHFHCFGCGRHGDVFDWLRDVREMSFRQAFEYLGGQADRASAPMPQGVGEWCKQDTDAVPPSDDADASERIRQGREAWDTAGDPDGTTLAYLNGRGLIPPPEPVIRSRPRIWWDVQRQYPEMLVAVTDAETGESIGCQITRLKPDGSGKADVTRKRINLCRGGFVRLFPPRPMLALAEGVETALAASAIFGEPCWATLGSSTLAKAPPLPPVVKQVMICVDHDAAGVEAARAAIAAYRARDLAVQVRVPTVSDTDFADVWLSRLCEGGDA